jgi:heme oxygenase (biliverdin-producing, ferredoxin)
MHAPPVDPNAPYSFVNTDMRAVAMKLHTPQQLKKPASGSTPPPPQEPAWTPDVIHYLQFLVDSLVVYETIEQISEEYPVLAPFRNTGLERSKALKEDIAWISSTYDLKVHHVIIQYP